MLYSVINITVRLSEKQCNIDRYLLPLICDTLGANASKFAVKMSFVGFIGLKHQKSWKIFHNKTTCRYALSGILF